MAHGLELVRTGFQTLQINVGRQCNQTCRHCHVDAAPWRTETMSAETAGRVGDWIRKHRPPVVDITGGAPELNDHFRFLDAPLHDFQEQPVIKQAPYRPYLSNGRPSAFHFCRAHASRNVPIMKIFCRIEPLPSQSNDRGRWRGINKRHRQERPL